MNPDVLWEKFSQIGIKTVQHLFQYFYIGSEERPNYKEVQDLVDDFSDVNFTISRKFAHYSKACCQMMALRYREDHEFFIRCLQHPIADRVRNSTAGGIISGDVLIGGLIHEESSTTSPSKEMLRHQYPCDEYLVTKSEEGLILLV